MSLAKVAHGFGSVVEVKSDNLYAVMLLNGERVPCTFYRVSDYSALEVGDSVFVERIDTSGQWMITCPASE